MEQLPNSQSTDTVTEGCRTFFTEQDEERDRLEPIAVIGYSLKFPQDATSPEDFWQMLLHGRSAMTEVPKDRWNIDGFYHPNPDRHDSVRQYAPVLMRKADHALDELSGWTFLEGEHRSVRRTLLFFHPY